VQRCPPRRSVPPGTPELLMRWRRMEQRSTI
jgi:hypothetical protein